MASSRLRVVWRGIAVAACFHAGVATARDPTPEQLAEMSLEELGRIEVTSVSLRSQRLTEAAASIYVITADDIRRSGATSLPEALRLAPNLQVARTGAGGYAITARGFNNAIGNKLQVLMDGRILYNPLFSGMFWDAHDLVLDNVERIEVISGPGSTLWGANAVNGVINVIRKPAQATLGGQVRLAGGTDERVAAARYGWGDDRGAVRLSAKLVERDAAQRRNGTSLEDALDGGMVSLRGDWNEGRDRFRVDAALEQYRADHVLPGDLRSASRHLSGEWQRQLDGGGALRVQALADWRRRDIPGSIEQRLGIGEVDFQHDVGGLRRNRVAWGASHRVAHDRVDNIATLAFLPADRRLQWSSVFVQDELALRESLHVTGGLRLEHNSYTGWEVLPSLRLAWTPSDRRLAWAAATRAVRTPSRFDRDLFAPGQPPYIIAGGPDFRSEVARIVEVGYRAQPSPRASWSVTAFHHEYERLRTFELLPGGASFEVGNGMRGTGRGVEGWGSVQATRRWRLQGGFVWLDQDLRLVPGSVDIGGVAAAGNDPRLQVQLRSSLDLPHQVELDLDARHVGELPQPRVPAYTALDLRLRWRPVPRLELELAGQNLGGGQVEFGNPATAAEFDRAVRLGLRWSF
jgi:iron complex outermembrane receptor protein